MGHLILHQFDHGIAAVDAFYHGRPGHSAIHLLEQGGQVAVIDTGTNHSIPYLVEALETKNLAPSDVAYVIVTHVHLDHAGGAGMAMQRFPNARLVVHPRGVRHMADPSKLVAGTVAVYGEEKTRHIYGEILPIPVERIIEAGDDFTLDLNGRALRFLDTPGHARHHFCIWDEASRSLFTGDSFGLSYRELDSDGKEFILPTTTPVQFEPASAHATIDRLMALKPERAFLTHFSQVTQLERHAADLHALLDAHVAIAESLRDAGAERHERLKAKLGELFVEHLTRNGCHAGREFILDLLAWDMELNAQGLEVWLDRPAP